MRAMEMSRRAILGFGAAGAASLAGTMRANQKLLAARDAVDHLLLGVSDLDHGIEWVERKTGVKAAAGGSHPGVGTRNALLSLGGRQYLEIIAPDPQQSSFNFNIDLRGLHEPRLINWAASAEIQAVHRRATDAGYQVFGPRDGSRARPDGKTLKWKSMGVMNQLGGKGVEPVPFFIEWGSGSVHPSQDSPAGCELESFEIEHLDPQALIVTLDKLGIEATVRKAETARLVATLRSPRGTVRLS